MIYVESKRKSIEKLKEKYPFAHIVDVTSKAKDGLIKLSPFYPHGDIPIPFSGGKKSMCVEGVWQGLKVFEQSDVDNKSFENSSMRNIKRTVRKYGKPKGHRKGVNGTKLLSYLDARFEIFLPTYLWVLENKVQYITQRLKEVSQQKDIVLLDYTTNGDVSDLRQPLSHAYLVKYYVEGNYPSKGNLPQSSSEKNDKAFEALVNQLKNFKVKDFSVLSGIRINIAEKIIHSMNNVEDLKLDQLKKTPGIGKKSIEKLLDVKLENTNDQTTLF